MESKVWSGKEMVKMLAEEPSRISASTVALYQVWLIFNNSFFIFSLNS